MPSASSASAAGVCQVPVEGVMGGDGSSQSAMAGLTKDADRAQQTPGQPSQSSGELGTKMI